MVGEGYSQSTNLALGDTRFWDGSTILQPGRATWKSALPRRSILSLAMPFRRRCAIPMQISAWARISRRQDIPLALSSGAMLVREAASRAQGSDAGRLRQIAENLERLAGENRSFYENPCDEELGLLMARYPDLTHATQFEPELPVWVDRERAQFSAWYELFPRSASPIPGQHGTFSDVEKPVA